jgi:GAF domain-containing protein
VAGCDIASISLLSQDPDTAVTTTAASDEQARNLDQLQLDTGEGPCLDAMRTGREVVVNAFADDSRYPSFGSLASKAGMNSCFSVPLAVAWDTVGSLNLYGRRLGAYGDGPDESGVRLAEQASVVVLTAMAHDRTVQLADRLQAVLASRAVIEQSKGILMVRFHTDAAGAFEILREASQRQNVKLRDVARKIVEDAHRPQPSGAP